MNEKTKSDADRETLKDLEKTTGKHPYSLYIIGTVVIFVFMLVVGLWASNSDWVVKSR